MNLTKKLLLPTLIFLEYGENGVNNKCSQAFLIRYGEYMAAKLLKIFVVILFRCFITDIRSLRFNIEVVFISSLLASWFWSNLSEISVSYSEEDEDRFSD